ncbi:uncharacterized protein LOC134535318 [Bacillus rossius redtenbacheri]|uniref:uncharacterized protein LOC134535318 n=1 Tax=Bacillus rossius redtenbacheri TaxID=93214 RepID=UPI002FDDA5C8
MRILYFPLIIFTLVFINTCYHSDTYNVGTALFREWDIAKKYWTKEDLALVDLRRAMQDLIPSKPMDTSSDEYASELAAYFLQSAEVASQSVEGRARTLVLMALYDVFGGYLRAYALPVSRLGYYAGTVSYNHVEVLTDIYEETKAYLRTDGMIWSRDMGLERLRPPISPLKVEPLCPGDCSEACEQLTLSKESGNTQTVPIPFLDDESRPNTLIVPMEGWKLVSITSRDSEGVLRRYYACAVRCLTGRRDSEAQTREFHSNLISWLKDHVIPHLKEDRWYPGFHGVLQIIETMKQAGVDGADEAIAGLWKIGPRNDFELPTPGPPDTPTADTGQAEQVEQAEQAESTSTWVSLASNVYVISVCGVCIFLAAIILLIFLCCRCRKWWLARKHQRQMEGGTGYYCAPNNIYTKLNQGYRKLPAERESITVPPQRIGCKVTLAKQFCQQIPVTSSNERFSDDLHQQSHVRGKTVAEYEQDYKKVMQDINLNEQTSYSSEDDDDNEEQEIFTKT